MTVILPQLQGVVLVFVLTFARAGAMIMLLPVIGDAGVPPRVRLAFALAVSAALVSVTARYYPSVAPPPQYPGWTRTGKGWFPCPAIRQRHCTRDAER